MNYIAILDYLHLDHSYFMKSFAEAMSRQNECSGIILHGDSPYTERLIQTGMMRNEAVIRGTRDLNHRIVALLADNGIAGIGVNGFQRELVRKSGNKLIVQDAWIKNRSSGTHLILSNLVWNLDNHTIEPESLNILAETLLASLSRNYLFVFPKNDGSNSFDRNKSESQYSDQSVLRFSVDDVPDSLLPLPETSYFCTLTTFGKLPDTSELQKISR